MPSEGKSFIPLLVVFLVLFISPFIYSQVENTYLIDKILMKAIENEVSGERAWDMVSKITRFHRIRGGGEGSDYNRCIDFLVKELKEIGLEEVKVKRYRANGFQKYFLWRSLVGWRIKEAELWLLEPYKKLLARYSDQAVSLMPYSQGGEAEGEVVYVGKGKSEEDYKDKDVKGKLVFATGGEGPRVHRQAVINRGALGVIVGPSDREDRLQFPDLIEVNRLSPKGKEVEKTGFGFALSRRQEREILSLFHEGKKVRMKAKVDAELFDGEMPVLEAKIIGSEYPSQEILIMGHLDHYKPGANDNASGSAGMVEMARNILALVKRGEIPSPKRTIRFLWLPEIHGAAAYLTEHLDLKDRGIAGLNLDMIGENYYLCESFFALIQSPYSVPGYINDVLASFMGWLDSPDFNSPRGSRLRFNYRIIPFRGGSDHIMFNDFALSIPTPMLGHTDVFHHTNLDTPEKCDPTEMKRIISLSLAATVLIANAEEEEAVKIAQEVYSQAALRISERTRKSVGLLHEWARDPNKRKSLANLYSNVLKYPQIQTNIEEANLREVKELCQEKTSEKFIEELAGSMKPLVAQEQKILHSNYELLCRLYKIKKGIFQPTELYEKATSLTPKKLFKGPLPWSYAEENLGPEDFEHYKKNVEKIGGMFDSSLFEIINLMDGKRTILDIRHIISCEFDETDIEFILHFVEDLKKMGLVEF
jgi:aminopeptidase YwaD